MPGIAGCGWAPMLTAYFTVASLCASDPGGIQPDNVARRDGIGTGFRLAMGIESGLYVKYYFPPG